MTPSGQAIVKDELIQAIRRIAKDQPGLSSAYVAGATSSDLYEAALFHSAVKAAQKAGGAVRFRSSTGTQANSLALRRSPGNLWSGGNFTHATVDFPSPAKSLEIHLGVYVQATTSKVAHECDIAILSAAECQRSRTSRKHPRARGLIAAIEAKNYSATPGLGVGRNFVGLASEIGGKALLAFAFPSASSTSLEALLAARNGMQSYPHAIPDSIATERLLSNLEQPIRKWLAKL